MLLHAFPIGQVVVYLEWALFEDVGRATTSSLSQVCENVRVSILQASIWLFFFKIGQREPGVHVGALSGGDRRRNITRRLNMKSKILDEDSNKDTHNWKNVV